MLKSSQNGVFLIPIMDKWLLFAPLCDLFALLNNTAAAEFRQGHFSEGAAELANLYRDLATKPLRKPSPLKGEICPSFLGIITTRGCNINCVYCNFGGPTSVRENMDPRIAITAIDWMAERLKKSGKKYFRVHFFGGEPFTAPELVDIVVHRTRYVCAQNDLIPFFDVSSNGVFSKSRSVFIGDYFDAIVLSLDGFKNTHNRNRPAMNNQGTFDLVVETARSLSTKPVQLCLRVCVTQDSVHDLEAIVRWMYQEFNPVVVNFEPLTPGELSTKAGLTPPRPYDFAINFMRAIKTGRKLGIKVINAAVDIAKSRISFCPVGTDALIVSADGRASACYLPQEDWLQRGQNMDVGQFNADGTGHIDYAALDRVRQLPMAKPLCEDCFCQWTCAGGCHVHHSFPDRSLEYDDFCIQTRIITACLLLSELGYEELIQELLQNRTAMRKLAFHDRDAVSLMGQTFREAAHTNSNGQKPSGALIAEGFGIFG